jgi:hypothetical protein
MAIRTYADTSVYGGLHDEEFAEDSRQLFDRVRAGRFSPAPQLQTSQMRRWNYKKRT